MSYHIIYHIPLTYNTLLNKYDNNLTGHTGHYIKRHVHSLMKIIHTRFYDFLNLKMTQSMHEELVPFKERPGLQKSLNGHLSGSRIRCWM